MIVDVSADYRFHDATGPTACPSSPASVSAARRRIANPGCYATAMALALAPGAPSCSPARRTRSASPATAAPAPRPRRATTSNLLRADNLMPYEPHRPRPRARGPAPRRARRASVPHVAPFFRGITMTHLPRPFDAALVPSPRSAARYDGALRRGAARGASPTTIPLVRDAASTPGATIGGFTVSDGRRAVVVVTLDNLLKGAASQAVQNLNLALGLPETMEIPPWQS